MWFWIIVQNSVEMRAKMAEELGLLLSLSNNSRRKREFKPRTHPLDEYDDVEFKKRFRLSKTTVEKLLEEVI